MTEISRGFSDFGRGLRYLLANPSLWPWVIAPAIATLLLMIGVILLALYATSGLTDAIVGWLPSSLRSIAGAGLAALLGVALAAAAAVLFVSVTGAIAGPFCELLSDAVERRQTGAPSPPFSLASFLRELTIGVGHTLRRLGISLGGAVTLFVLSLVPVAGALVALALGALFTARAAAYDCYDAVLARRALPYQAKVDLLARYRGRTLGLGAVVALALLVPGINLVALGIGATGATLACRDLSI